MRLVFTTFPTKLPWVRVLSHPPPINTSPFFLSSEDRSVPLFFCTFFFFLLRRFVMSNSFAKLGKDPNAKARLNLSSAIVRMEAAIKFLLQQFDGEFSSAGHLDRAPFDWLPVHRCPEDQAPVLRDILDLVLSDAPNLLRQSHCQRNTQTMEVIQHRWYHSDQSGAEVRRLKTGPRYGWIGHVSVVDQAYSDRSFTSSGFHTTSSAAPTVFSLLWYRQRSMCLRFTSFR